MTSFNKTSISILVPSDSDSDIEAIGLSGSKIAEFIKEGGDKVVDVSVETISRNLVKTVSGLLKVLDTPQLKSDCFVVDEVEVNLAVGAEGEISVLSSSVGTNTSSSLTIRLKRVNHE